MKRKRAPGGGRKPKGEFSQLTSSLTIRIPEDMRKQLESEAASKDQSVAQVLLWHLRRSFNRDRERERNSATRAFCFLISVLADKIRWAVGAPTEEWQNNPFVFRSFKIGVAKLLDAFEPKGKIRPPPMDWFAKRKEKFEKYYGLAFGKNFKKKAETWKSPTRVANEAVERTLSDLFGGGMSPEDVMGFWADDVNADASLMDLAESDIKATERTWYGMADVRRDLQLTKAKDNDF
jgi:hypothetical protein